ncbi:accessory factor UbiK family protein [Roseomonas sp. SSH11]|uniref:Accessory factor UbiK family protein n=1 Tax=Pararoseomonas baculiformis TaxID=2820812 RepID=A0ABS4A8Q7_9PROT|nr:accessory factor UbiK family protein [Pararoseomonas baculiformis]MBP0443383.1 accessory factor UbiK family protein [Pararoseomonas baculiformis]
MQEGGQGSSGPFGSGPFGKGSGSGPFGGRGKFFDDLAGVAGGAFSVLSGARAELEAMVQAQTEALTARLNLVKREELDAALEVARRAREEAESLSARVAALEARLDAMPAASAPAAAPFEAGAGSGGEGQSGTSEGE